MLLANPLPALCVGILGTLLGLFSAFMPAWVGYFVPWGYFIPLNTYRIADWDQASKVVTYMIVPFQWPLLVATVVFGRYFCFLPRGMPCGTRRCDPCCCVVSVQKTANCTLRPSGLCFFILPIISAGYGTFNYLQNLEILRDGWYSLWTQHTLSYSLFFFPCMVAVYAAYLWRLEHIGHNWNLIMAEPVPPFYLFLAKLLVVTKLVLLTQAFVFVLYWFCGRVFAGFTAPPPAITIFYLVRSVLGGLAVVAAQLLFSMVIRSFALPVFWG